MTLQDAIAVCFLRLSVVPSSVSLQRKPAMVKRKLEDEDPPPPLDDMEAWVSHARLARHVRCLLSSKHPMAVLKRYEERAHEKGQRCCVHVAAWVALLPEDSELLTPAVDLLAHLLATRPRTRYRPWLEGSLRVVARRSTVFGDHPSWRELKKRLPRKIWDTVDATSEGHVEVKRLHTAIAKWHNANAVERNEILEKVREKLANSSGEQRLVHLIVALRKLVAALSPPQALGVTSGSGQTEAELDLGPSQQKLRRILLKVLKEIDLTDAKVKPILSHLEQLIHRFQRPLEEAADASQWHRIAATLEGQVEELLPHGRWSDREKEDIWDFLREEFAKRTEASSVAGLKVYLAGGCWWLGGVGS
eukprot:Skav201749  [mRNA]  locus=scaffold1973:55600:57482:- [translate_table: standard]